MVVNRVIYAIALIGALCTFIATNSAAALTLTIAVALAPFAGISASLFASKKTRVTFETQPSCTVGQDQALEISLQRPMPLRGRMELSLSCHNLLLETTENITVSLAPSIARHEKYLFPLETDTCGHIVVSLASMRVIDIMGFTKIRVRQAKLSTSYTVYPPINDISIRAERASFTTFSGSSYDRQKKGQDHTEVFEVRDFHNGDSLKSVHWKFSARFDDLLVREPSRPTEHNVVLLCDTHAYHLTDVGQLGVLNAALGMLASISLALVRQGVEHTVAQSDGKVLHTRFVENRVHFDEMVDELMDLPLPHGTTTDAAPFQLDKRTQMDTKVVLITNLPDDTLPAKLNEIADLCVVRISSNGTAGVDESGGYPLIHLPVSAVAETKILEF